MAPTNSQHSLLYFASSSLLLLLLSLSLSLSLAHAACPASTSTCVAFDETSRMGYYEYMAMAYTLSTSVTSILSSSSSTSAKFSAVGYTSSSARVLAHPTSSSSRFERAINGISLHPAPASAHAAALSKCASRHPAPDTILLVSNARGDTDAAATTQVAKEIKGKGTVIVTIAVGGDGVGVKGLKEMASEQEWAFRFMQNFAAFGERPDVFENVMCRADTYHTTTKPPPPPPSPSSSPVSILPPQQKDVFSTALSTIDNAHLLRKLFLTYYSLSSSTTVRAIVVTGVRRRGMQRIGNGRCLRGRRTTCAVRLVVRSTGKNKRKVSPTPVVRAVRKVVRNSAGNKFGDVYMAKGIIVRRRSKRVVVVTVVFSPTYYALVTTPKH